MLMLIYSSIIQPKFDYAITIWGYTCDNNLHKIQRLPNREARIVTGNYDYVTTKPMLVKQMRKRKMKHFGHIIRHNILEKTIIQWITTGKRGRGGDQQEPGRET